MSVCESVCERASVCESECVRVSECVSECVRESDHLILRQLLQTLEREREISKRESARESECVCG